MATRKRVTSRGKGPKGKLSIPTLLIVLAAVIAWTYFSTEGKNKENESDTRTAVSPGGRDYGDLMAVKTAEGVTEVLKKYKGMDLSFNPQCHIPNWVSWELTSDETSGEVTRSNKFSADPDIEGSAETWDYSYSGYDRGHMAPAGDMRWDSDAMEQTFYMTNICPQVKTLNAGTWKNLEEKCRQWAEIDSAIYIVCGPVIKGKPIEYIGDSRVYVPREFFKVIISPYATPARGIGFIMPNGKVKGGMQACAVTIDSVEALTGHDFFASLPDDVESDMESQCDFHFWSTYSKRNK